MASAVMAGIGLATGGITAASIVGHQAKVAPHAGLTVSTRTTSTYGTFLVSGHTLYTLVPSKTACTSACHAVWPELLLPKGVKHATAGSGVSKGKLGTLKVAGDRLQVTYGGKPLFLFVGDKKAGDVNGNVTDKWGKWAIYVTAKPKTPPTTTTTSGGGVGF